ncbi:Acyl-coenzyme A thioesterase 8 [Candida viswanathii]|uniref:Acyl-coenzyme A thioesterase 8 n=1 Tax=Candida viswanathii TaxID=5486 RepID=A0A367XQ36_9ASCO|nr:Acyl-coenzyme A thioesterase 8 [Candida viswanathii]RCK54951.1 Acyl-coenzyme A thioesterase 8 [Candida viswanathii]
MTLIVPATNVPTVDISTIYDVKQLDANRYRGVRPLQKQTREFRGVFGGNLVAQSVVVAMRSVPAGFHPNSVHAYYVRAVTDETPIEWEVEETTTGRTFANRLIRGLQNKKVVFTANISLTRKNSNAAVVKKTGHPSLQYQRDTEPYYEQMRARPSKCKVLYMNANTHLTVRQFPEVRSRDVFSFLVRFGNDGRERIVGMTPEYQYAALAALSDWVRLRFYFENMGVDVQTSFDVSLDHSIYFHDDGFDATEYLVFSVKVSRISHSRVLYDGQIFNDRGVHVASIRQERLYVVNNKPKF